MQDKDAVQVPAWPFVTLSFAFGVFALGPYFALWKPSKQAQSPPAQEELRGVAQLRAEGYGVPDSRLALLAGNLILLGQVNMEAPAICRLPLHPIQSGERRPREPLVFEGIRVKVMQHAAECECVRLGASCPYSVAKQGASGAGSMSLHVCASQQPDLIRPSACRLHLREAIHGQSTSNCSERAALCM